MNATAPDTTTDWYAIENADEIASPAVLIYPDRIAENLRRMIAMAGDASKLRPHVKTHKMARVVEMKLAAGITKFKASTIAEVEMTLAAGGKDVLLAYPLIGPNIRRLIELQRRYPDAWIAALVDDESALDSIAAAVAEAGTLMSGPADSGFQIPLLVDLNVGMNRTGIRPEHADALYERLCRTAGVSPAGLHAYDGHLHEPDAAILASQIEATFEPVWRLRDRLQSRGLPVPKMVVSGTPTSHAMAAHEGVEVGAGTTVLWDAGQAKTCPDMNFQNAAVLLARVISRPAPGQLCLDLGHKAVASEFAPPRAVFFGLENATAVLHSEEHLVIETPNADRYPVGSVLYGVPVHVCPTIALHQNVWCVRDRRAIETWPVTARNRSISV